MPLFGWCLATHYFSQSLFFLLVCLIPSLFSRINDTEDATSPDSDSTSLHFPARLQDPCQKS